MQFASRLSYSVLSTKHNPYIFRKKKVGKNCLFVSPSVSLSLSAHHSFSHYTILIISFSQFYSLLIPSFLFTSHFISALMSFSLDVSLTLSLYLSFSLPQYLSLSFSHCFLSILAASAVLAASASASLCCNGNTIKKVPLFFPVRKKKFFPPRESECHGTWIATSYLVREVGPRERKPS